MRKLKKVFSLVLAITMVLGVFNHGLSVQATEDLSSYVKELISYYESYEEAAETDIQRLVEEMKLLDEEQGEVWGNIMKFWSTAKADGFVNVETIPEGLPEDDSMAVIVLGFALTADGQMKDELIGRLQTGLDFANAYENCYVAVTGGSTATERPEITEGELMGAWMLEQGLDESRLIIENRSADTVENVKNTYQILREQYPQIKKIVLVTSHYHIPRGSLLLYSTLQLEAMKYGEEPLTVLSNVGYDAGHEGYERIGLEAKGLCTVAGVNYSSLPDVTLSVLESIHVSQEAAYVAGEELNLTVTAKYDSGFEKDISELIEVSGFEPELGAEQTITLSYTENDVVIKGKFILNETEKEINDAFSKVERLAERANETKKIYNEKTLEILELAMAYVEPVLEKADPTEEELNDCYEVLRKAFAVFEKRENIAENKPVTASHNTANAKLITDGDKGTYWEGKDSAYVPIEDSYFVVDLQGIYKVDALVAVPYYAGVERYYHYDISVSTDGEEWIKIAEQRSVADTTEDGAYFEPENAVEARFVRVDGVAVWVKDRADIFNFHMNEMEVYGELIQEVEAEGTQTLENLALYGKVTLNENGTKGECLTDGVIKNEYSNSEAAIQESYVVVELPKGAMVSEVNVVTYYNNLSKWYTWEVFISEDQQSWTSVGKYETESNPGNEGYKITLEEPTEASYVKVQGLKTNNTSLHLVEIEVFGTMDNVAKNKLVEESHVRDNLSKYAGVGATNGSMSTSAYWDSGDIPTAMDGWDKVTEAEYPYVIIDLENSYDLESVNVMTYRGSDRIYHYRIYTSADGETYTLLGQKDDAETALYSQNYAAQEETVARYIKVVGTYHSKNAGFHLLEVRATGTLIPEEDADYRVVEAAFAKIPEDLSVYTKVSVIDLIIAIARVEEGLKISRQAEVDAMAAAVESAVAALEKLPITIEVCEIYPDVDHGQWYEEFVQFVHDNDIMTGNKDTGMFNPNGSLLRQQFVMLLWNMEGKPVVEESEAFEVLADADENGYYADALRWAYNEGIMTGVNGKYFQGSEPLKRQQLAKMLYEYAEKKGYDVSTRADYSAMENADQVADYAKEYMAWAVGEGMITGKNGTNLAPMDTATRAAVAKIVKVFCRSLEEVKATLLFCSDFQTKEEVKPYENLSDVPESLTSALDSISETVYNDGVTKLDSVLVVGDYTAYTKQSNYEADPVIGMMTLQSIIREQWKDANDFLFIQGNHDNIDYPYNEGANEYEEYIVYCVNATYHNSKAGGFPWKQGKDAESETSVKMAAEKMKAYFEECIEEKESRPVFIMVHLPLHFTGRTSSLYGVGDNLYSSYLFEVINEAAEALDIVYLFGHNHSNGWDNYMGGSRIFKQPGDTILIPDLSKKNGAVTDYYKEETLNFTYLNAGYIGYMKDSTSADELTATVCTIYKDKLVFHRYSEDGMVAIGANGAYNEKYDDSNLLSSEWLAKEIDSPSETTIDRIK